MVAVSCICLTTWPRRERFLPDALRSYRQQTFADRELIIVNDGTPLVSHAPDVIVVNLPDVGRPWTIGEKRNVGVRAAHGQFIATWDDDDVSLPERLAEQMAVARRENADVVVARKMLIADADMHLVGDCDRGRVRHTQASALLRRNAVVAAGGYPISNYLEDAAVIERIRFYLLGRVITMPSASWYVLRRHGSNVTLDAGETNERYLSCGMRSPEVARQQRAVDAVRSGPGGRDVTP